MILQRLITNKVCGEADDTTSVDGFTTFGLKIWQPEVKKWVEISVLGNAYKCREEATISPTKSKFLTTSHGNILTNGTIIDVGGISMMFQSPVAMSRLQNNVSDNNFIVVY